MNITYKDFDFKDLTKNIKKWSWQEITFGLNNKLITETEVIKYANTILVENMQGFNYILELAIAESHEDIQPIIGNLVELENKQSEEFIKEKWLYAILSYIYTNRKKYKDALELVEIIYADFDYPEDIETFVKYMPINNTVSGTIMTQIDILYMNWYNYLSLKENIYCNNSN